MSQRKLGKLVVLPLATKLNTEKYHIIFSNCKTLKAICSIGLFYLYNFKIIFNVKINSQQQQEQQ